MSKKMLEAAEIKFFMRYDIDKLLRKHYSKDLDCYHLIGENHCSGVNVCNGLYFWDLNDPECTYMPAMREILLSSNPLEMIAKFNETYSAASPYHDPDTSTDIVSFADLVYHHSDFLGDIEFWMSKLMIDGHIETLDEFGIWIS